MSSTTSANSEKHPYLRVDCWTRGIFNVRGEQLARPLKENFSGKARERVENMIKNWDSLGNELAK